MRPLVPLLAAAVSLTTPALAAATPPISPATAPAPVQSAAPSPAAGEQARHLGPLVTATGLAAAGTGPLILDIRGDAYAQGHIPGAVDAPYALFRGPADNPGALVPPATLETTLERLGIQLDRPVAIVHQGSDQDDFGAAARVYWTLKSAGVTDIAILNGGMNAWAAEGLPTDTAPSVPQPTQLSITWSDRWRATEADVARISAGGQDSVLLDARPPAFFSGDKAHGAAAFPGTVPGARNVAHTEWFAGTAPAIAPARTAADVASRLGIAAGKPVVTFCNTGHWAATEWFALSELAGLPDVRMYPESMVGYTKGDHPIANKPGLVDNLMRQIKGL